MRLVFCPIGFIKHTVCLREVIMRLDVVASEPQTSPHYSSLPHLLITVPHLLTQCPILKQKTFSLKGIKKEMGRFSSIHFPFVSSVICRTFFLLTFEGVRDNADSSHFLSPSDIYCREDRLSFATHSVLLSKHGGGQAFP